VRRRGLPWLLLLATGCAYYNGLYNANRLANDARRAEREGRVSEARSLWSRAAVKAESVSARFPRSKFRDDALLLWGTALEQINACTSAVVPLRIATDSSPDDALRREARLALARCRLEMLEPDAAIAVLDEVVDGNDPATRAEALYLRGLAKMMTAGPAAALADLEGTATPDAAFPRAMVVALLVGADSAARILWGHVAGSYGPREARWLEALDTVGRYAPAPAAALVDSLVRRRDLTAGQQARLLLADGIRWLRTDESRSRGRFAAVLAVAGDSVEGRTARAHIGVIEVGHATRADAVPALLDSLNAAMQRGGPPTTIAGRHVNVLSRAAQALASDTLLMNLFVAAEDVRDSLNAPDLAAALFYEVARRAPESVIAPKALLAVASVDPTVADSLVRVVRERYPASVYTRALFGDVGDEYRVVEDSLRALVTAPGRRR